MTRKHPTRLDSAGVGPTPAKFPHEAETIPQASSSNFAIRRRVALGPSFAWKRPDNPGAKPKALERYRTVHVDLTGGVDRGGRFNETISVGEKT